jgi:integrase
LAEEFRCLEVAEVDLERGRFKITKGKSKAARRTLTMRIESREILSRRIAECLDGWIFPSRKNPGKHIGEHQRMQAAIVAKSGVNCVPYDMRHTFASRAANEEKMPLPILMSVMGHANLRSIMKYVHTNQSQMDREMARMDEFRPTAGPLSSGPKGDNQGLGGTIEDGSRPQGKLLN